MKLKIIGKKVQKYIGMKALEMPAGTYARVLKSTRHGNGGHIVKRSDSNLRPFVTIYDDNFWQSDERNWWGNQLAGYRFVVISEAEAKKAIEEVGNEWIDF